jgi:hypothetical protein
MEDSLDLLLDTSTHPPIETFGRRGRSVANLASSFLAQCEKDGFFEKETDTQTLQEALSQETVRELLKFLLDSQKCQETITSIPKLLTKLKDIPAFVNGSHIQTAIYDDINPAKENPKVAETLDALLTRSTGDEPSILQIDHTILSLMVRILIEQRLTYIWVLAQHMADDEESKNMKTWLGDLVKSYHSQAEQVIKSLQQD